MDQPFIPAGLEQLLQFAILLFVVVGFFRQFATQRDIKKLDDRLVKLESGQTEVKAGLAAVESRQGALETRLGNVETRLGNVETRLGNVETRLGNVETRLGNVESGQTALEARFGIQEDRLNLVDKKADAALDLHNTVHVDIKVLQASVNRLESYFETPKLKSS